MPENKGGGLLRAPWLCADDPDEIRSAELAIFFSPKYQIYIASYEQTRHNKGGKPWMEPGGIRCS